MINPSSLIEKFVNWYFYSFRDSFLLLSKYLGVLTFYFFISYFLRDLWSQKYIFLTLLFLFLYIDFEIKEFLLNKQIDLVLENILTVDKNEIKENYFKNNSTKDYIASTVTSKVILQLQKDGFYTREFVSDDHSERRSIENKIKSKVLLKMTLLNIK